MPDDIIRNPKRKNQVVAEKYESEYERMGIVPKKFTNSGNYASQMATLISPAAKRGGSIAPPLVPVSSTMENSNFLQAPNNMIDNNEFMSFDQEKMPKLQEVKDRAAEDSSESFPEYPENNSDENNSTLDVPSVGDYILMIRGELVVSGDMEEIERKAKSILYEEDIDYSDVSVEDLIVLKRVDLKVGVYIKE